MAQVQQELELARRAEVLVTDRSVVDNFASTCAYRRRGPVGVEPLIRRWATLPTTSRSACSPTSGCWPMACVDLDAFRDEIEAILDRILPISPGRCLEPAR